jgi:hypothetical protein
MTRRRMYSVPAGFHLLIGSPHTNLLRDPPEKGGDHSDCKQPEYPEDESTNDKYGQQSLFTHDNCLIRILF